MPVGKTRDAGWEIGVSRTVHHPIDEVWELLTSARGRQIWLGAGVDLPAEPGTPYETEAGTIGELRSFRPLDRLRLTWQPADWDHETVVQLTVTGGSDKTVIGFHQERLTDAAEREQQRAYWSAVMDRVVALLD